MTSRPWPVICTACICVTIVTVAALETGHNGLVLKLALVILGGLGGFAVGLPIRSPFTPKQ